MASMQIPPRDDPQPRRQVGGAQYDSGPNLEIDLSPPRSLSRPLWRSLWDNLRDRVFPERLPPLKLSSRPVDVGMLPGDFLDLAWYRTIFTNLGNVITPETLPPLQLESHPIEVGELISDLTAHPWWVSLIRNAADSMAPERPHPVELTSRPVEPEMASGYLQVPRWSSLLSTPKVFLPDAPEQAYPTPLPVSATFLTNAPATYEESAEVDEMVRRLRKELRRSHLREKLWIVASAAMAVTAVMMLAQ
jgi:hypothetical protein